MSDSEKMGRCRKQIEESYAHNLNCVPRYAWITADAIDRLAADVAAVKAKVDAVSPDDVAHLVECEKAWVRLVEEKETAAIRERDEARAEVERLKAIVHSDAGHMAKILIENERLRAGPAAPQPAAPPAVWLTERERRVLSWLLPESPVHDHLERDDDIQAVIRSILARAGSPPVVEVPAMGTPDSTTTREKQIALAYRAALDKAGVAWKEVGRE